MESILVMGRNGHSRVSQALVTTLRFVSPLLPPSTYQCHPTLHVAKELSQVPCSTILAPLQSTLTSSALSPNNQLNSTLSPLRTWTRARFYWRSNNWEGRLPLALPGYLPWHSARIISLISYKAIHLYSLQTSCNPTSLSPWLQIETLSSSCHQITRLFVSVPIYNGSLPCCRHGKRCLHNKGYLGLESVGSHSESQSWYEDWFKLKTRGSQHRHKAFSELPLLH